MELFYINNILDKVDLYIIPDWVSANSITLMGQILPFVSLCMFLQHTTSLNDICPDYFYIFAGIAFKTFSLFDILDGIRARRLQCSSPLGRIIDEALD